MNTDLVDTNDDFCYITIQHIREIVDMSNNIDKVHLVSHALEEQVEIGSATIQFHIQVRQIRLKKEEKAWSITTSDNQRTSDILEGYSTAPCTPSLQYSRP